MSSMNRVTLMGNLTRDPSLRNLSTGSDVAEFGLAINEAVMSKDGKRDEKVCFVDIVVWNAQAKACAEHLHKGARALVEGKLQFDEWNDKATGDKRSRLRVRADRVHFVGGFARSPADGDEAAPARSAAGASVGGRAPSAQPRAMATR
jgi:single-strand DNA-binding protein